MSYVDPFSGITSDSCSVTAKFMADNADSLKKKGMTETAFRKAANLGAWGVHKAMLDTYAPGKVLFRMTYVGPGKKNGKKYLVKKADPSYQTKIVLMGDGNSEVSPLVDDQMEHWLQSDTWDIKVPGDAGIPPVSPASQGAGMLTDEDMATLFVKTKDEVAAAKGINIKGANPQLDQQVYQSIAQVSGYTPAEAKAKVDAYKASGKKLSALKKKVVPKKAVKVAPVKAEPPTPTAAVVKDADHVTSSPPEPKVFSWEQQYEDLAVKNPAQLAHIHQAMLDSPQNFFPEQKEALSKVFAKHKALANPPAAKETWESVFDVFESDLKKGWIDADYLLLKTYSTDADIAKAAKAVHAKHFPPKKAAKKVPAKKTPLSDQPSTKYPGLTKSQEGSYDIMQADYYAGMIDEAWLKNVAAGQFSEGQAIAARALLTSLGKPWKVPKTVPVQAGADTVAEATADALGSLPKYTDEQVTKAYIKAKDQLAASDSNPWTLYTQNNPDFESAIAHLMEKSYDVFLSPKQIKSQLARYTSQGNKVSVLKKKMTKTGEYKPQAPSLKKSKKGAIVDGGPVTKTAAKQQIDALAGGYVPDGSVPHKFSYNDEMDLFDSLKNVVYKGLPEPALHAQVKTALQAYQAKHPDAKVSLLDIIRVYDKRKAEQLGIPNGNFYEKRLVEWAASPEGKKAMMSAAEKAAAEAAAKKAQDEFLKNLPPMPTDSADYRDISVDTARELLQRQMAAEPWMAESKSKLREYTGGAYRTINSNLRRGGTPSAADKARQEGMRALDVPILTHRGTGYSQFGVHSQSELIALTGQEVQDKGFLSTSVGGRPAFGGEVMMEIEWPAGSYGAFVKDISLHRHEDEYLGAAGTHFKVLRVEPRGYQTVVRVRAIPGSHTRM